MNADQQHDIHSTVTQGLHPHSHSLPHHTNDSDTSGGAGGGANTDSHSNPSSPIDDDGDKKTGEPGEKKTGRRKINIEFIEDKSRRHITFSKRKAGIMKKAYELSTLTGTQVLLLVASETGHVYTFATPKLQPLITKPEGKNLIQSCLNAPEATPVQQQQTHHGQPRLQGGYAEPPVMYPTSEIREPSMESSVYDEEKKEAKNSYPPIGMESYSASNSQYPPNLVPSYMPMVGSSLSQRGYINPQYAQAAHSQGYPSSNVPVQYAPTSQSQGGYPNSTAGYPTMHSMPSSWNKGMQSLPMSGGSGMPQGQSSQGQPQSMSGIIANKQSDHSTDHT